MKILLADEHILFREGLASMLKDRPDMKVVGEAGTLRKAITKATELQPDVILMDITFPDGNGLDAIEPILKTIPGVNIVILTIHESNDILFSAISKGAKGYLLKNRPMSDLVASLLAVKRGEAALSRSMTMQLLDELVRISSLVHPNNDRLQTLTSRELEVLTQISTGATNREIGNRLVISENTVKVHVYNILKKLNLRNRLEAARFAKRYELSNGRNGPFNGDL